MDLSSVILAACIVVGREGHDDLLAGIKAEFFEEIEVRLIQVCASILQKP